MTPPGRVPSAEAQVSDVEALLIAEGAVSEEQLARARRIATRMKKPRPVGEVLVELGQLARSDHDRIVRLHRSTLSIAGILQEDGALGDEGMAAYDEAREESPRKTERELLVGQDLVTEEQFLQAFATKYDVPFMEPEISLLDRDLVSRASGPYLMKHRVLPVRIIDGTLTAIMVDPQDASVIQELERIYSVPVKPCVAPAAKILQALNALERRRDSKTDEGASRLQYREIKEQPEGDEGGEGAVRIVDYLLCKAIELGASDLHIEPLATRVRVRVRVDGVLRQITDLPQEFAPRIISRVKILAGADIAERRLHQDGRIFVKIGGREVDIRVSTYASMFGETLVLRLLDREKGIIPLESLGFEDGVLTTLRDVVLRTSSGLVLVTGPTGSGKTSTLYSFVDYVQDETMKIISSEDPVEYVLDGVAQCSVNEKTGPTFADSLRAIVRQDPDVIIVGEIRDGVTAGLAVEAALTGHKVFSTFHTEDSVTTVTRLLEMGVEPFLVASTLSCVVAQRLVRRLCSQCRKPGEPSRKDLRFLSLKPGDLAGAAIMEGEGCKACGGSGFKGRLGIHEVLQPDDDFRDAILERTPSKELRALARRLPRFMTLQEDGLLKVMEGFTTLNEVVDNAPRDVEARPLATLKKVASVRRLG